MFPRFVPRQSQLGSSVFPGNCFTPGRGKDGSGKRGESLPGCPHFADVFRGSPATTRKLFAPTFSQQRGRYVSETTDGFRICERFINGCELESAEARLKQQRAELAAAFRIGAVLPSQTQVKLAALFDRGSGRAN